MAAKGLEKVVFFDRDGTLSLDNGYTVRPEDLKIYPGAGESVGRLQKAGFRVVLVTNQSAVGRGMATAAAVEATNAECLRQLRAESPDAVVDRVCYCPHAPEENCLCRKPRTGMIDGLPFGYDPKRSWMVGDKCIDLEFGVNAGLPLAHCVLVFSGEGRSELERAKERFDTGFQTAEGIRAAGEIILRQ